jgi:hypothetical protein
MPFVGVNSHIIQRAQDDGQIGIALTVKVVAVDFMTQAFEQTQQMKVICLEFAL